MSDTKTMVMNIYNELSEVEKRVFVKVLKAEKEKIYLLYPPDIDDKLLEIIREEVK